MLSKYSIATALAASSLALGGPCPPHGAVLPAPKSPGKTDYIKSAAEELTAALDKFTAGYNTSGISVQARSIHEDKPFFSYHHTPAVLSDVGVSEIDSDTIYRVGSVSKMITALAVLLIEDLDLNASVLDFLPELADVTYDDDVEAVDWEHVTVQSLANHLSGLATDSEFDLLSPL
jgi:CubicO group peptidase (beta-lactamase class C family)